jgi:hypothetical protein
MDNFNVEDYEELMDMGFDRKKQKPPEEEFFHAVYISGQDRKNHIDIVEKAGNLQVRGVKYNLNEVHMIITTVKPIMAKIRLGNDNQEIVECFSFMSGSAPYTGTSGRTCPANSAERATVEYCKDCRSQLIVSGILCNEHGSPELGEDKKPIFIFIKGKGIKYSSIADYLTELQNENFTSLLEEKYRDFEKRNLNNKKVVTKISIQEISTHYGPRKIFKLDRGIELPSNVVFDVLKISKKTLDAFQEKFDLSLTLRKKNLSSSNQEVTEDQKFQVPEESSDSPVKQEKKEEMFDFDSLEF